MSFRSRRVIISTPFYMGFLFFLLKYIFLLIGDVNEACLIILAILIGSFHLIPMFFEAKKSTVFWRMVSTIDGVCMWASLMFVIDLAIIYLLRMFIHIPDILIYILLAAGAEEGRPYRYPRPERHRYPSGAARHGDQGAGCHPLSR